MNLELQREEYRIEERSTRTCYSNHELVAVSEAEALLRLNSELAALEVETGIILESHGCSLRRTLQLDWSRRPAVPAPAAAEPLARCGSLSIGDRPSETAFEVERLAAPEQQQGGKNHSAGALGIPAASGQPACAPCGCRHARERYSPVRCRPDQFAFAEIFGHLDHQAGLRVASSSRKAELPRMPGSHWTTFGSTVSGS